MVYFLYDSCSQGVLEEEVRVVKKMKRGILRALPSLRCCVTIQTNGSQRHKSVIHM